MVRLGERNDELRYSLRSLVNLPHRKVWIVGHKPTWVTGIEHVSGNRYRMNKWSNVPDNLRIACERIDADRLLIMNDDFYVTEPVKALPSWHRGTLAEHIATTRGAWRRSLQMTERVLAQNDIYGALSYEMHIPVVMEREKLAEVLQYVGIGSGRMPAQWRTLYGNWWKVPSQPMPDVKLRTNRQPWQPATFLSTDPGTFRRVSDYLAVRFPEPSRYESSVKAAA